MLVKIDFDRNAPLVGKYGVHAIPACVLLNQFGERVADHVGYMAPTEFSGWLAETKAAAFANVSKNQPVVDRIKAMGQALELPDAPTRDQAAASLLEIYVAKDADDDGKGGKLAEEQLRGFVQSHPAAALGYVNDRRLAVRILFTALLSEKLGADFSIRSVGEIRRPHGGGGRLGEEA